MIEEQFKYAIAFIDALCFTELCFILYTYLQDKNESKTWIDTILCVLYATTSLFHMTFFTVPAYRLYERNQTTTAIATTMFQNQLNRKHDQFLDCLLLLFTHKLQVSEINFTAGGFFVVTRQLFLTFISLVLTYVAIMLQFGHIPNSCLVQSSAKI
uniref:Gustatory receptor n=1 Tax=Elaeophora elaphi TaxID=1147741 RepID=A0A0R3RNU2_9BILA